MAITKEELLDHVANMTVLELSELVKAFEEKFGVSAAPAMAMGMMPMMGAGGADAGAAAVEEKTEFNVVLLDAGEKKINVIKVVRELTGLGLKEAKDLTEKGGNVKEAVDKATAEDAKKKLEEQGAKVELK